MRAERELDLELLDAVTWPDYVWEWLRYMGAPAAAAAAPAKSAPKSSASVAEHGREKEHRHEVLPGGGVQIARASVPSAFERGGGAS